MEDEELLSELKAVIQTEFESIDKQRRLHEAEMAQLSDEEWWDRMMADNPPGLAQHMEPRKEEIIRRRHMPKSKHMDPEEYAEVKARHTFPALKALRQEQGLTGPVTADQWHRASMHHSYAFISEMSEMIASAADREVDPQRREFLSMFSANVKADHEDFKTIRDLSTVTESQLSVVTANVAARLDRLIELRKRQREEN